MANFGTAFMEEIEVRVKLCCANLDGNYCMIGLGKPLWIYPVLALYTPPPAATLIQMVLTILRQSRTPRTLWLPHLPRRFHGSACLSNSILTTSQSDQYLPQDIPSLQQIVFFTFFDNCVLIAGLTTLVSQAFTELCAAHPF